MPPIAARWPRILSEQLVPVVEPLVMALEPAREASPREVIHAAARALLDGPALGAASQWPAWLAPHQIPAADRLTTILSQHGGAVLADEVGLGKSYVALAVALIRREPFALVVPAVLVSQWKALLIRFGVEAAIMTHEQLSSRTAFPHAAPGVRLFVIDEAHRFRNPDTNRYRMLARLLVGASVLLVTATPVHNRIGDLFHLLRLFLRDHALAALGVPSLHRAAREGNRAHAAPLLAAVAARLVVSRSRERIHAGYPHGPIALTFPRLASTQTIRAGPAPDDVLVELAAGIRRLRAGGSAAPLLRLMLLRRLASSLPAFRASLLRHDAFLDLSARASAEGRGLSAREFQACFPRAPESDIQLVLFPLLTELGRTKDVGSDRQTIGELRQIMAHLPLRDPKADALDELLTAGSAKTIVFSDAQHTVRYLLSRFRHRRAAAVFGTSGRFGAGSASRREVLNAFAPRAQNAGAVPSARATDLLIATDLLSEGLNLQDAERVVHYDLPWSPARLTQRVGRIDRLGSLHQAIATVTFIPPESLAKALTLEERLTAKVGAQVLAGSHGHLDWCDRLSQLRGESVPAGACAAVSGSPSATILVVRIGQLVEAIVVADGVARAGPAAATRLLTEAYDAASLQVDFGDMRRAIAAAAPLIKARLAAVQDARWRASDRDRFARRLIPWILSAGRRAALRGNADQLRALDALVSRLALGMTAGEELLLEDLLSRAKPLAVHDMLTWHQRLPLAENDQCRVHVELVAALALQECRTTLPPFSSTSTARSSTRSS